MEKYFVFIITFFLYKFVIMYGVPCLLYKRKSLKIFRILAIVKLNLIILFFSEYYLKDVGIVAALRRAD